MSALLEQRADLTDLGIAELEQWLSALNHPRYRANQILTWVYRRQVCEFAQMNNIPRALRERLAASFRVGSLAASHLDRSCDGCVKLLFELSDGERIESVIIPDGKRCTMCLSTQVGCAMGCAFCATARIGLVRNLRPGEIVGQLRVAAAVCPLPITNVVLMGMGEPLHNYQAVVASVGIMSAPWGMALAQRRITVSTVGLIPQMERLLSETKVNLAVSLNATEEGVRRQLMPVEQRYSLGRLLGACRKLPLPRRKRVTFEYVLLRGVNDSLKDARRLVGLLAGIRCKVNLIAFNPFAEARFRPSADRVVEKFRDTLHAAGIHASVRQSRGQDIGAACGQLAVRVPVEGDEEAGLAGAKV